jgi:mRNA-decapping enzyme 1B
MLVPNTNTRALCTGDDESAPKTRELTHLYGIDCERVIRKERSAPSDRDAPRLTHAHWRKMATMDKEKQLEYNVAVLKRRDAAISGVIDMSGHVVLYRFSEETQSWDRRNVEGSLFVVSRSEEPKYQFVVLNRISSENLVESVSSDFQMELTDQFLLYRNTQQEISGIWFYSPSERASIAALLQSIVGGAQPTAAAAQSPTEPTAVTDDSAPANNVTQAELLARTLPNPHP